MDVAGMSWSYFYILWLDLWRVRRILFSTPPWFIDIPTVDVQTPAPLAMVETLLEILSYQSAIGASGVNHKSKNSESLSGIKTWSCENSSRLESLILCKISHSKKKTQRGISRSNVGLCWVRVLVASLCLKTKIIFVLNVPIHAGRVPTTKEVHITLLWPGRFEYLKHTDF